MCVYFCTVQVIYERSKFDVDASAQQENIAYSWVKVLQSEDVEFLFNQPYTISIPQFNVIVVHAGIVPGLSLDSQRPIDMTTMRGVVLESGGHYSGTESKACGQWAASWPGPQHVYFGHNASRGLQRHPFATGLDTGCVYGRQLTGALISSPNQQAVLYSVPAQKVYKVPTK